MLKKFANEYLFFTRKERNAVIILSCLITVILLLPYLVPDKQVKVDKAALQAFELELAMIKPANMGEVGHFEEGQQKNNGGYEGTERLDNPSKNSELFYFDPNTLSIDGWRKLGLPDKTARTIQNYLSKGGKFRRAEDIGKIYGMRAAQVARLMPFVKLEQRVDEGYQPVEKKPFLKATEPYSPYPAPTPPARTVVDVNTADSSAFMSLPGIGSKLAARIINFRSKLGGFYAVDQLSEVYGLPDSTFQKIKQRLTLDAKGVTVLNINSAPADELKKHPYLKQNLAAAIVEYRTQHGDFNNVEDLQKIDMVTPELFGKLAPYLKVK